jgi:phosphoribosylaminoimidazole-succinocarboxamide synthase
MSQLVNKGKVRDVYENDEDTLIINTSNRISAFDKVWCEVPNKGKVLNLTR